MIDATHDAGPLSPGEHAAALQHFQQSVLPHLDAAFNLARWLTGHGNDAQDVTQEAMLRAFRFGASRHGEDARAWLLTIVRHAAYAWLRRHRPQVELSLPEDTFNTLAERAIDAAPDPAQLYQDQRAGALLTSLLEELPIALREVLVLRELEELSYRDIASIADLPIGTVMSRLARARQQLRLAWARRGTEETTHGL